MLGYSTRSTRAGGGGAAHLLPEGVSEPSPPGPPGPPGPDDTSAAHPSLTCTPRAHAHGCRAAGAPPRTRRRRRSSAPAAARDGARSAGHRGETAHLRQTTRSSHHHPLIGYHRNATTRATRAGKGTRTASSPFVAWPCTACHTASARVRDRDTWDQTPVAPLRPTDAISPDAPLLRVARDPRDAREVSGRTGSTFPLLIGSQRLVVQLRFHPATAWREAE